MIQLLIAIAQAIPAIDKFVTDFHDAYEAYKLEKAEKKARETGDVEDLQKEIGKKV